jgi:hypothetical protein
VEEVLVVGDVESHDRLVHPSNAPGDSKPPDYQGHHMNVLLYVT